MASEPRDAALDARCRTGDQAAWNELVERFSRYVYAIAVQVFRLSEHDAEDVFQTSSCAFTKTLTGSVTTLRCDPGSHR
jgi:hypothetical protein